ncbi:MAG: hypothetical protein EOP45_13905 [Sphingobacteriaceae bacterium]|nr:MAG: hypothetical protein EOP45_13905 [Sphingobacteriaceae bacterium]
MKKILFLSAIFSFCLLFANAQARQGTIEYNKQQVPCYIIPYSYSKSVTEDAIKDRMKAMGLKGDSKKGFTEYNNVVLPDVSPNPVDAKFKVEKGGSDNTSMVYMIVTPAGAANTQAIAGAASTQDYSTGASTFLSNLGTTTGDYSLELDIKKQEDEVKKAEKKQNNLVDDGNDMQKKLQKLQNDMEDNRKKQTDQVIELQKQRDALTQLQAKRRVKP